MPGGTRSSIVTGLALWLLLLAGCGDGDGKAMGTAWQQETAQFHQAAQIDASNVTKLGAAWEFDGFVVRGRTQRAAWRRRRSWSMAFCTFRVPGASSTS